LAQRFEDFIEGTGKGPLLVIPLYSFVLEWKHVYWKCGLWLAHCSSPQ